MDRTLLFLRHGQTDWNKQRLCVGQVNVPLNDLGRQQATAAARSPMLKHASGIACSPLMRARETGEIISRQTGLQIIFIDDLQECCLGELEGQVEEDLSMFDPWLSGETPTGAESWAAFSNRVLSGIYAAFQRFEQPLIVSHSGVLWAFTTSIGKTCEEEQPNGEIIQIEFSSNVIADVR
ncbi:MAG: histidine phosphatase family protein [Pseudomonadota bacterium]